MSDSRADLISKIEKQRGTIREHIAKYNKFKGNDDFTSSATKTIRNSQALINGLKDKDKSLKNWGDFNSYEDSWKPN